MTRTAQPENRDVSIVVLYCQHSVAGDVDIPACARSLTGVRVRSAMVPCSSKVQASHLLSILDQEANGLEVIACPVGSCGLLVGSERAAKRVSYARDLLEGSGLGADRLGISHGSQLSADEFVARIAARARAVMNLERSGEDQ